MMRFTFLALLVAVALTALFGVAVAGPRGTATPCGCEVCRCPDCDGVTCTCGGCDCVDCGCAATAAPAEARCAASPAGTSALACGCESCRCPDCDGVNCSCDACECVECGCAA